MLLLKKNKEIKQQNKKRNNIGPVQEAKDTQKKNYWWNCVWAM